MEMFIGILIGLILGTASVLLKDKDNKESDYEE